MYPAEFEYRRADTVADAIDWLENTDDVRLLAGGHGLLPEMKTGAAAPDVVVDIGSIDRLDSITAGDDCVTIGALTTHADVLDSDVVERRAPPLAAAAAHVGDIQIRHRGTIGGNLAEATPGADLPPVTLAADATVRVESASGGREIPATEFFRAGGGTALAETELLVEVRVPTVERGGYVRRTHPATGYAMIGVVAVLDVTDDTISSPRVAVTGVTDSPVRLSTVEDALDGTAVDDWDALASAASKASEDVDDDHLHGDVHASGRFRLGLLDTYVERALREAIGQSEGGG